MKSAKQSAFPTTKSNYSEQPHLVEPSIGLTKREYFAAMAMQAILSSPFLIQEFSGSPYNISLRATQYADELIKQLEK